MGLESADYKTDEEANMDEGLKNKEDYGQTEEE